LVDFCPDKELLKRLIYLWVEARGIETNRLRKYSNYGRIFFHQKLRSSSWCNVFCRCCHFAELFLGPMTSDVVPPFEGKTACTLVERRREVGWEASILCAGSLHLVGAPFRVATGYAHPTGA
jgi:hypothetical protein